MKRIRYTKFTGDLSSSFGLEDLMQALSDFLLDSGFQDPYASFHDFNNQTMENLRDTLRETIARFHKDVMVVETAYPTRGTPRADGSAKNMIWPFTPEGQLQFLTELIKTVKDAPEHKADVGRIGFGREVEGISFTKFVDRDCRRMIWEICEASKHRSG